MANITLTVDAETLRRARIRALEQGTSVNSLVRRYLGEFAGDGPGREPLLEALELARSVDASSGPRGRGWTREDLYEGRATWPRPRS